MSDGSKLSERFQEEMEELRRVRDELRVRVHLGKAEMKDRWEKLEDGLQRLEGRAKQASQHAGEAAGQLEEDARKLLQDLREGYRRIRASL